MEEADGYFRKYQYEADGLMANFRVKNFERFQHYKERKPPWVKLYRDIWSDRHFFRLKPEHKLFLIGLFTVASYTDNLIPDDVEWLADELRIPAKLIDFAPLVSAGFLIVEQDASAALADCQHIASEVGESSSVSVSLSVSDSESVSPSEQAGPPVTGDELVESWNRVLAPLGLPAVAEINDERRAHLRNRLREHPEVEWWNCIFNRIKASDFLRGQNPKNWRCTFDFLIKNGSNALKIYEGQYGESKNGNAPANR